jgi:hypothetical protein
MDLKGECRCLFGSIIRQTTPTVVRITDALQNICNHHLSSTVLVFYLRAIFYGMQVTNFI